MDKYFAFCKLMDFMADYAEVVDADMNAYNGGILIVGENDGEVITIEVSIKKKEENKNAEELE